MWRTAAEAKQSTEQKHPCRIHLWLTVINKCLRPFARDNAPVDKTVRTTIRETVPALSESFLTTNVLGGRTQVMHHSWEPISWHIPLFVSSLRGFMLSHWSNITVSIPGLPHDMLQLHTDLGSTCAGVAKRLSGIYWLLLHVLRIGVKSVHLFVFLH